MQCLRSVYDTCSVSVVFRPRVDTLDLVVDVEDIGRQVSTVGTQHVVVVFQPRDEGRRCYCLNFVGSRNGARTSYVRYVFARHVCPLRVCETRTTDVRYVFARHCTRVHD
jgi:hypothetical protein